MATQKPLNLQPVCMVPGCKRGASIRAILGSRAEWMKTCCKHHAGLIPKEWTKTA